MIYTSLIPRIFVDNDALAFFNVSKFPEKQISIAEIISKPVEELYGQKYNFLVKKAEMGYFGTNNYKGPFGTVSVTSPCIVFCAYTTYEDESVKSSGVYHAQSNPLSEPIKEPIFYKIENGIPRAEHRPSPNEFKKRLYQLIATVRSEPNEGLTLKAVGCNHEKKYLQNLEGDLKEILAAKNVDPGPMNILLGGASNRITEFYPQSGLLVTYFSEHGERVLL